MKATMKLDEEYLKLIITNWFSATHKKAIGSDAIKFKYTRGYCDQRSDESVPDRVDVEIDFEMNYSFNIPAWLREELKYHCDPFRQGLPLLCAVIEKASGDVIVRHGLYDQFRIPARYLADRKVRDVEIAIRKFVALVQVSKYSIGLDRDGENTCVFWGTDKEAREYAYNLACYYKCTTVLMVCYPGGQIEVIQEWHKAPESLIQQVRGAYSS